MDSEKQLEKLLDADENEVLELKEAKEGCSFKKIGKYFSALSNEANLKSLPYGWLVFGIKDDRSIVGTKFRLDKKKLHSLKSEIAEQTTGRQTFIEIFTVNHSQGRVVMLQIPAALQGIPIAFQGHYYGRDNEALGALNMEEIERIRAQNRRPDWSIEICPDATVDDLSHEAVICAQTEFVNKNPKVKDEIIKWDWITFLNKAKLAIRGKLTRAAILLLGNAEAAHLLNPASATITWILKDRNGVEKDYQHFSGPLLLSAELAFNKIRNLKYRYMIDSSLFPEEVDQFDPYIIREALNNAIAHQDYSLGGNVTVVEFEDGRLCFSNLGGFIPGSVENVICANAPESRYRNRFLVDAMVGLNMIDTIGSGIRKMFMIQKERFFPMPEYDISDNKVQVIITGRVLDINYARKLVADPNLQLEDILLLDRVQKQLSLNNEQVKYLKQLGLIEGRKPNFHISVRVAQHTGDKAQYIQNRGVDDKYYKQMICDYLTKFGYGRRADINNLLLDKLPTILSSKQKVNKITNFLSALRVQGIIKAQGKLWRMSQSRSTENSDLDSDDYQKIICDYVTERGSTYWADLEALLINKMPNVLNKKQKVNKIRSLLNLLKRKEIIECEGRLWRMCKSTK